MVLCGLLDLHPMLICAREEERASTFKLVPSFQHIGQDHAIHVTDVW